MFTVWGARWRHGYISKMPATEKEGKGEHHKEAHLKKIEENQKESRHRLIYMDAALGDEGIACSWVNASMGEDAACRLLGDRNTTNAELAAIEYSIRAN